MTRIDPHEPAPVGTDVVWPVVVRPFVRRNGAVGYELRYGNGHSDGEEF